MFKYNRYSCLKWTHIIIHHSATVDGATYSWDAIDRYHKEYYGWSEIGYNFGLERVDNSYKYCLGRSLSKSGGHTKGQNWSAIGICLVGNYDEQEPNAAQYWLLASLCRDLQRDFNIPTENIKGHNEFSSKTCPGNLFSIVKLKKIIEYGNNGGGILC